MYRILVADDEGIMLEAFKNVISSTFGDSCIVETAKTGRAVSEIAETFHPISYLWIFICLVLMEYRLCEK